MDIFILHINFIMISAVRASFKYLPEGGGRTKFCAYKDPLILVYYNFL